MPGKTATVLLTGNRETDIAHAKEAWQKLNPGMPLPENVRFHHDLLNVTEHIETIKGKPTKVLIGELPAIPTEIHGLFHQGSHSAAARFYDGMKMGKDTMGAIKDISKEQASLAGTGKGFLASVKKDQIGHNHEGVGSVCRADRS